MTDSIKITAELTVTRERISDLLCTAFEGGSNYWIGGIEYIVPDNPTFRPTYNGSIYPKYLWVPLNEGGTTKIRPDGSPLWHHLGLLQIAAGLRLLASEYPNHWRSFMTENEDAATGDLFLQLCLFGEATFA